MERDQVFGRDIGILNDFNSHAHVERDTWTIAVCLLSNYFNSHAHVERDRMKKTFVKNFAISTHTLTWSVTAL